ncbi:hypothetical protein HYPSUDRAFT_815299 [Hypholoma sublateritium FD-334 SS-4]|uniref:Histone deacetylase interacting domain-containing protein n=1 Tax=Hypholoma sublateritium (strain FD-334 SS-4) TaxID=945553 RepID=A0A0D2NNV7_HYPSF|nr:hypothetical protein HYPSUDRAFT_815299 [Hypholoma sublateritium FD-334 SS-4]
MASFLPSLSQTQAATASFILNFEYCIPTEMSSRTTRSGISTDPRAYLDAVKSQFQDRPEVYDQFLNIMKDFKNHAIDAHIVIERVARLFHGQPSLLKGFTSFLPVGYNIDVSPENVVIITTPLGTTTQIAAGL